MGSDGSRARKCGLTQLSLSGCCANLDIPAALPQLCPDLAVFSMDNSQLSAALANSLQERLPVLVNNAGQRLKMLSLIKSPSFTKLSRFDVVLMATFACVLRPS
jgi:hypothetical protein